MMSACGATEVTENAVLTTPYAIINALSAVITYYGDRGGAADVGAESSEPC